MTAYVITGDCNIRQLGTLSPSGSATARAGGDTVNTNGFIFTIDQDTRYGLTGTTGTSFGTITISATLGGNVNIDGRYVRLIPFTVGSGTITLGATLTCGGATGIVIGVHSSLTTAPVDTGVATGWIKVTGWNGVAVPASTVYTSAGYTFTTAATGTSIAGWIEVLGDDAATISAARLGDVNIRGEWYVVGTTSGASNQTMQIPNNGNALYIPGVFIEKTAGLADYEFYPNAGNATTTGTEAERGKVVWIDATGLVRIGNSGAATNGHTPAAGLQVVVGNVFLQCCTAAARTVTAIPNATLASRYDFTTTGGGAITIDKASMGWYPSFAQPYAVTMSNTGITDSLLMSEVATPVSFTNVGTGGRAATSSLLVALSISTSYAGGTMTDCVWARNAVTGAGQYTTSLTDVDGFVFVRNTFKLASNRGANSVNNNFTRANSCTFTTPVIVGGGVTMTTCYNTHHTNTVFINGISGTTTTALTQSLFYTYTTCTDCTFDGITFPVTDNHPYLSLLAINASGCARIKLRNVGSRTTPLSLGSVNQTASPVSFVASAESTGITMQRVYTSNTRSNAMYLGADNTSSRIIVESCAVDYADAGDLNVMSNMTRKGFGATPSLAASTAIYGTHFIDCFTSATAGRIVIIMNEPSAETVGQVVLTGGAKFNSAGGLYMPTIGMTATFVIPYYILGHTSFTNTALVMGGGTATNYTYEYSIDVNDGNGYSAFTTAAYTATTLGTALSGITTINASFGFKLSLKVTTGTTNTSLITSAYVTTVSTAAAQEYQYPIDEASVSATAVTPAGAVIQGARVLLKASSSAGPFPYNATVTITRSVNTATVAHTAHGLTSGDYMAIADANEDAYNGVKRVTKIDANSYSYTVAGSPATPATGVIKATFVALYGTTDANGSITTKRQYPTAQPVSGWTRKNSTAPFYQQGVLIGTISPTTGFSGASVMVSDE